MQRPLALTLSAASLIASLALGTSIADAAPSFWNPPTLFSTRDFAQVGVERGHARVVYISAQGPLLPGEALAPNTPMREQVRRMLQNVSTALQAVGATPADVVNIHTYVADYKFLNAITIGREMRSFFNQRMPVSTFVPVNQLVWPNAKVQTELTVVLPE